jgi:SAM-dependent methyltransferase
MSTAPRALRTEQTAAFLLEVLRGRRRVLEVGCGRGDVARALAVAGHEVTALDLELPDQQPTPGVTYVEADFLAFDLAAGAPPFDAVVFTSSLHHISPLDRAVDRAASLTTPGGLVVADDFDLDAPDARTLRWYYEIQELLAAAGAYPVDRIDPPIEPPRADLVARWRDAHLHDPPLHTGVQLRRALGDRLALRERRRTPYLYRYICGGLPDDAHGAAVAAYVLEAERRGIAAGRITPVGLRLLADCA